MIWVAKGDHVAARWLGQTSGALGGSQIKVAAVECRVRGIVTHVRGNHPISPTSIRVWVRPDEGGDEVVIDPDWITEHRACGDQRQ
jgi:hypothetical protein